MLFLGATCAAVVLEDHHSERVYRSSPPATADDAAMSAKSSFLLGLSPAPATAGSAAGGCEDAALPISLSALAMRLQHIPAGSPLLVVSPALVGKKDSLEAIEATLAGADPDRDWAVGMAWPSFTVLDNDVALPAPVRARLLPAAQQGASEKHPHGALRVRPLALECLLPTASLQLRLQSLHELHDAEADAGGAALPLPPTLDEQQLPLLTALLRETLTSRTYLHYGALVSVDLQMRRYTFRLASVAGEENPRPHRGKLGCKVTHDTAIDLLPPAPDASGAKIRAPSARSAPQAYAVLGGLGAEIEEMRKLIELPLLQPELFEQYGLKPPRGVLLYGPPGTGKTSLARAVCRAVGASVVQINGPELSSAYHGETEAKLRAVFADAHRKEPCIVVIDEIDALAPRRDAGAGDDAASAAGDVDRRVVATLLTLLDGMGTAAPGAGEGIGAGTGGKPRRARVAVIAATNRPNALDPALRRPGRLDREIELGVPALPARVDILRVLLQRVPHALSADDVQRVAGRTHAYVGADLAAVVREAAMRAIARMDPLPRHRPSEHGTETARAGDVDALAQNLAHVQLDAAGSLEPVRVDDLLEALNVVRPSGLRELAVEVPRVLWSDVALPDGTDSALHGDSAAWDVVAQLRQAVEAPLKHASSFARLGIAPPRGVLLYGPPGCSKTLLARALATESGANFLAVKGPELYSMYVGESERRARTLFRKARAAAPCILFFDEIDALTTARGGMGSGAGSDPVSDRLLGTLLTELDGLDTAQSAGGGGVVVLAATNRPEALDAALLRPGRLDVHLYVPPPPASQRLAILQQRTASMPLAADVDLAAVAAACDGCSGADVVALAQAAGMAALRRDASTAAIARTDWDTALRTTRRSIAPDMLARFRTWRSSAIVR